MLNDFISKVFSDPTVDLSLYKDKQFCLELQIKALRDTSDLLACLGRYQVLENCTAQPRSINRNINTKHPVSDLSMLDYCIIAGLDDVALKLVKLGCKPSKSISNFKLLIDKNYPAERPEIISTIYKVCKQVEDILAEEQKNYVASVKAKDRSAMRHITPYMRKEYQKPALMFIASSACAIILPLYFVVIGLMIAGFLLHSANRSVIIQQQTIISSQAYRDTVDVWGVLDLMKKKLELLQAQEDRNPVIVAATQNLAETTNVEPSLLLLHDAQQMLLHTKNTTYFNKAKHAVYKAFAL